MGFTKSTMIANSARPIRNHASLEDIQGD